MALSQEDKEIKVVEIREKEIEIATFDTEDATEITAIRGTYNYSGMQTAVSDYLATRTAAKQALENELQALKDELIAP